jgi:very-short-patch-repair endonuclease
MVNERARTLRKSMSSAERLLWRGLRSRQLDGARFRRQHPIGVYIVDFVCLERRLVIEVDGGQHTEDNHIVSDARRDRWLGGEGYRVMRVSTTDVLHQPRGRARHHLGGIARSAVASPCTSPPPGTPSDLAGRWRAMRGWRMAV